MARLLPPDIIDGVSGQEEIIARIGNFIDQSPKEVVTIPLSVANWISQQGSAMINIIAHEFAGKLEVAKS